MKIMVMDGQGGGVGRLLVESITAVLPEAQVIAVGTNAVATANMMKGGTTCGATGENAVIYNSRNSDVICGPIGILMANAMLGEITPAMASAISSADKPVYLIPISKCNAWIAGCVDKKLPDYVKELIEELRKIQEG